MRLILTNRSKKVEREEYSVPDYFGFNIFCRWVSNCNFSQLGEAYTLSNYFNFSGNFTEIDEFFKTNKLRLKVLIYH